MWENFYPRQDARPAHARQRRRARRTGTDSDHMKAIQLPSTSEITSAFLSNHDKKSGKTSLNGLSARTRAGGEVNPGQPCRWERHCGKRSACQALEVSVRICGGRSRRVVHPDIIRPRYASAICAQSRHCAGVGRQRRSCRLPGTSKCPPYSRTAGLALAD